MYWNFIGVSSPECVTTDDEFYYLYYTTDKKIRRKHFKKEGGSLEEKSDQYIMPLAETHQLTQMVFDRRGINWNKAVPVYSSLEFKEFFFKE